MKKFSAFQWQNWLLKSLIIIIFFAPTKAALYRFSIHFSLYEGWVSWYFPVGLLVISFILLPFRYWPAIFLANEWGSGIYQSIFWQPEWLKEFNGNYIEWIFNRAFWLLDFTHAGYWSLIPIALLKYKKFNLDFTQLKSFIYILIACTFYRAGTTSSYILTGAGTYNTIPVERKFEMVLGHFLGGFVGITTMMLVLFLPYKCWQIRHHLENQKIKTFLWQLIILVIIVLGIYYIQPQTLYLMRIFAIIPLVYFLVKFGWLGVTACALTFNILIFIYLFGVNETGLLVENQIYVISYALTALLLGALYEEQQQSQRNLKQTNAQLSSSNQELTKLSNRVQLLAQQLVSVQEKERHFLSQELHDEVGQNISALKIELKVLEKQLNKQNIYLSTSQLDAVSDHIYDSVYSVLNWLRPRVLDDLGLYACLTGSYFKSRLEKANILYQATVHENINQLDDNLKVAIFRITQEAITNTLRYADAKIFIVKCIIMRDEIKLTLIDDGKGFDSHESTTNNGGFGLSGIEDRVTALGGNINILSIPNKGTKITIYWPFEDSEYHK